MGEILGYFDKATAAVRPNVTRTKKKKTTFTISAAAVKAKQKRASRPEGCQCRSGPDGTFQQISGFNSQAHLGEERFEKEWRFGTI